MNQSHLQNPRPAKKSQNLTPALPRGCTWCAGCALTNFPCKLRLFFSPPWGVQVHPLVTPMNDGDEVLLPWYAVRTQCANRRRSSATAAEDIQWKSRQLPTTSAPRRRGRFPMVYRRCRRCPRWNMPIGSRTLDWAPSWLSSPKHAPCASWSFATDRTIFTTAEEGKRIITQSVIDISGWHLTPVVYQAVLYFPSPPKV